MSRRSGHRGPVATSVLSATERARSRSRYLHYPISVLSLTSPLKPERGEGVRILPRRAGISISKAEFEKYRFN